MSPTKYFALVITSIVVLLIGGAFEYKNVFISGVLASGVFIVAWLVSLGKKWDADEKKRVGALRANMGNPPHFHHENGHVLALDPVKRIVTIINDNGSNEYGFDKFREVESFAPRDNNIYFANNLASTVASMQLAKMEKRRNEKITGLYIFVKDIKSPNQFIRMTSGEDRCRWIEIFRQYVFEK